MVTPRNEDRANAKKNGHAVPGEALPEGWNQWPGISKAAAQLQTNTGFIYRMVNQGHLRSILAPDGLTKYNPDDLRECAKLLEIDEANTPKTGGGLSADEFKAGNELVRFVQQSFERMVPILVAGFESASARAVEQSERDQATIQKREERITALEAERDKAAAEREKHLADEHARKMVEASYEAGERRKDKAFNVLTDRFAPLLLTKFGLDGDPKIKTGLQLLSTIKRDQLLALLATGMLEEAQIPLVLKFLGELTAEEKAALQEVGVLPKDPPPPEAEK